MAESRKQRAVAMVEHCEKANADVVETMISDDFTFRLMEGTGEGVTPSSPGPVGKKDSLQFLASVADSTSEGMNLTIDLAIEEGDNVGLFGRSDAHSKTGKAYRNVYCWHFQFNGDKITSFHEYCDTHLSRTIL